MGELKQYQASMTIEEQIENLKAIGLIINDEEYAKKILNDISYFRLIKAYSLNLKQKNGKYHDNIKLEQIVDLYLFNAHFRQILIHQIEKIEINLRCRIANYFGQKYGILGYLDVKNFADEEVYKALLDDITKEVDRNSRAPFIKNFKENYVGGKVPIYALVEVMSFGTISKFYKNMLNSDKKVVAATFGVGYTYLQSWLESIAYVRNICAHYGRLYNAKLTKKPGLYKEYSAAKIENNRIFAVLLCLKYLLKKDLHWNQFVDEIDALFETYEEVCISTMGFPENWKDLLRNT